jgi:hypothetical protein
MLLAGALSLIHRDMESEVEPFETTAPIADLNVGRVAIGSSYDVISDEVAELGAEGTVEGSARFGLPHERLLRHSQRSVSRERARSRLTAPLGEFRVGRGLADSRSSGGCRKTLQEQSLSL